MLTYSYLSLLIVDDELSIREGLSHVMPWEELGIKVVGCAENGEEALQMIATYHPHIVITDIKMPKCDGLTLIKKAKEQGYETEFIIMSGYNDFKFAKEAIKFGVQDYLLKPIKKGELIETLTIIQNKHSNTTVPDKVQASISGILKDLVHNKYKPSKELDALYSTLSSNMPLHIITFDDVIPFNILKSELQSLIPPTVGILFECDTHKLAMVISPISLSTTGYEDIHTFCHFITTSISSLLGVPLSCGIGDGVSELSFIWKSYHSANEYLAYKMYDLDTYVFDGTMIDTKSPCPLSINNTYSESLVEVILSYDLESIDKITKDFFEWILYIPTPPPSFVRGMCIHLMIDIQKKLSLYSNAREDILKDIPHQAILDCLTLQDIKQWFITSFTRYAKAITHHVTESTDPVIDTAITYIQQNIASKLPLEEVASHVHLSKSYFTSLFKEKTGESFRNYVLNLKIEYAKKLLKESDITVSNLSHLLGYEEYRSFNRAFKKSTGKTPSEYHKIYSLIKEGGV